MSRRHRHLRKQAATLPAKTVPAKTVFRVTTPAQMVAALPLQIGYVPTESLIVQCCHEPRGRVGLTVRLDLPDPEREEDLAQWVIDKVREQHATRVVLVLYTDEPDSPFARARSGLMGRLTAAFSDIVVTEALLVRGGRFWSYVCEGSCCPPEGRPIDEAAQSTAVQQIRLEQQVRGQGLLASREELEAQLTGPAFLEEEAALQRCDLMLDLLDVSLDERGRNDTQRESLRAWEEAVADAADPRWQPTPLQAAMLAVSLTDVFVRDAVAATEEERRPDLTRLVEELTRRTPPPYDAPVCTLLAWITYLDGAGTVTSIALDRALRSCPDYSMAQLLSTALINAVPPDLLRKVTDSTRAALRRSA